VQVRHRMCYFCSWTSLPWQICLSDVFQVI
jgi:hypothetical protein